MRHWSVTADGARFEAGLLCGNVELGSRTAPGLAIRIHAKGQGTLATLSLGDLWIESDQSNRALRPTPSNAYVQEPYLVVPLELADPAGLSATLRIAPKIDRLTIELRLQTVDTLDYLCQHLALDWNDGPLEVETRPTSLGALEALAIIGRSIAASGRVWNVFFDVGESGAIEPVAEQGLDVRCFRQPLEKGVILVARLGIQPASLCAAGPLAESPWDAWVAETIYL